MSGFVVGVLSPSRGFRGRDPLRHTFLITQLAHFGGSGPTRSTDAGWGAGALDALLGWELLCGGVRNNPQHLRVLTNEMLATRLAERAGLPLPGTEVVEVNDWLVEHTAELNVQPAHNAIRCVAGLQFGSRFVVNPLEGQVFDYIPAEMFGMVRDVETLRECWCWINGRGTRMGGRRRSGGSCGRRNIRRRSSIRDIALMPASGRFRIIRCGGFMHGTKCMRG